MSMRSIDLKDASKVVVPINQTPVNSQNSAATGVSSTILQTLGTSSYSLTPAVQLSDGSSIALPSLTEDQQKQVQNLFGGLSPEQLTAVQQASQQMAQAIYSSIQSQQSSGNSVSSFTSASYSDSDDDDDDDSSDGSSWSQGMQSSPLQSLSNNEPSALMIPSNQNYLAPLSNAAISGQVAQGTAAKTAQDKTAAVSGQVPQGTAAKTAQDRTAAASDNLLQTLAAGNLGQSSTVANVAKDTAVGTVTESSAGLESSSGGAAPTAVVASPAVSQSVQNAADVFQNTTGNTDYDSTIAGVAYMGVLGLQGELTNYANYMQTNINAQNTVSNQLSTVRQALADWPAGQATQTFTWTNLNADGSTTEQTGALTQSQASALADNLQGTLSSMSDQTQLDQLQLQSMTQNYQSGINTVSQLLSMFYQTDKTIINNIRPS